jgi:molybdopterin molybdotransferase
MIPYEQAVAILRELGATRRAPAEEVPLDEAIGRVLAAEVRSPEDVPSFDNSAMDGFALRAADTAGAAADRPVRLRVVGCRHAGEAPDAAEHSSGTALEIMTGAAVPPGLDAVVKIEDVGATRQPDGSVSEIRLTRPLRPGENFRGRGEDIRQGQPLLPAGSVLRPEHLLALGGLGITRLRVRRRPSVAVLATGLELVPHDTLELVPGMIRNSTSGYLLAALADSGARGSFEGIVRDDVDDFRRRLARALDGGADVLVTTGAVSMGRHDFVVDALRDLGARVAFHKTAIRPGKPLLVAVLPAAGRAVPVVGFPGNPVSTAVGHRFFLDPFLRETLGRAPESAVRARLVAASPKPEGLRCFYKGRVELGPEGARARLLAGQESFRVGPLLEANGWVVLPEAGVRVEAETEVDCYPQRPDDWR